MCIQPQNHFPAPLFVFVLTNSYFEICVNAVKVEKISKVKSKKEIRLK